jgi:manganese/zinc/iron transport system permease protein
MLAIHLAQHENLPEAATENRAEHLCEHIRWDKKFAQRVVRQAIQAGYVTEHNSRLILTDEGRKLAELAVAELM